MDNYTYIQTHSLKQVAELFCTLMEKTDGYLEEVQADPKFKNISACKICPVTEYCWSGHVGIEEWLRKEINHDKKTD